MWSAAERSSSLGWVILRVAVGITFIAHGIPKLLEPPSMVDFFQSLGIPFPLAGVVVVGLVEVLGGLAVVTGKGLRLAAALLALILVAAILLAKRFMGFLGGWELDFVLLAACISLIVAGGTGSGSRFSRR